MATHEVLNQPPPLHDYDPLARDRALSEALRREGAEWAEGEVAQFGRRSASREAIEWGFLANENPPRLRTHDRFGNRIDEEGALIGMGMTEKQGGCDVRANTTRAMPLGGGAYSLTGHKWFCSAPMCDAFLVLAQAPKGLSCFLLARWSNDQGRNSFHLQRLKDKLGNRSNASSEVEFDGAWAALVGEEGRGVQTIL